MKRTYVNDGQKLLASDCLRSPSGVSPLLMVKKNDGQKFNLSDKLIAESFLEGVTHNTEIVMHLIIGYLVDMHYAFVGSYY